MKNILKDGLIKNNWGPKKNPLAATVIAVFGFGLILSTIVGNFSGIKDEISISSWQDMNITQGVKDIEQYKDQFWAVARKQLIDTPMEGAEGYFWELKDMGIDPVFGLAVAMQESKYCSVYVGNKLNHSLWDKNCFGILIQTGPRNLRRFSTYRDAILSHYGFGSLLSRLYLSKGLDTIKKIAPIYCENGGLPHHWGDRVTSIYKDLWQQIKQV